MKGPAGTILGWNVLGWNHNLISLLVLACHTLSHRCHVCVTDSINIVLVTERNTSNPSKTFFGSIFLKAPTSFTVYYTKLHLPDFFTSPDLPPLNEINLILPRRLNHFYTTWSLLYHVTSFEPITWRNLEGWFDKCYDDSRVGSLRPILSNHLKLKNTWLLWFMKNST